MRVGYNELLAPSVYLVGDVPGVNLDDIIEDVAGIEYTDSSRGMDVCSIMLRNTEFKYANDQRFSGALRFKLRWGYPNLFSDQRTVVVRGASPSGFDESFPMIQLTSYDVGAEMARGVRPRNWGRVQTSVIARRTAAEYGFTAEVDDSHDQRRQAYVQPAGVSPYEYLSRLARAIGFDFYVRNNTLYYHRMRTDEAPEFEYEYFFDRTGVLTSFVPDVTAARPPATRHAGTNTHGAAAQASTTTGERSSRILTRYRSDFETVTGRVVQRREEAPTRATPETSPAVQAAHARAQQTRIEMRATTATATFVGQPRLAARKIIKIIVPECRYWGLWRVEEVTHRLGDGQAYSTSASLTRSGINGGARHRAVPANQRNQNATAPATERAYSTRYETVQGSVVERQRAVASGGHR